MSFSGSKGLWDRLRDTRFTRAAKRPLYWVETLSDTQFVYLLLVPTFVVITVFAFWPLVSTFFISLHENHIWGAADIGGFIGLQNYIDLLTGREKVFLSHPLFDLDTPFQSALIVTFLFTIISVVIEALLGIAWALVLDRSFRGRRWVRLAVLLPWGVPVAIHGMMFFLLFSPGVGLLVEPLNQLGLISQAPLAAPSEALWLTILADIWKTTPFVALITLAAMQSIDRDLYDVAKVNGASKWQQFKLITYPLILPALLVALLFRTIQALKVYGIVEIMAGCNTVPTLSCMVVSTFQSRYYGTSATVAIVTAMIVGVFVSGYIIQFRKRGL